MFLIPDVAKSFTAAHLWTAHSNQILKAEEKQCKLEYIYSLVSNIPCYPADKKKKQLCHGKLVRKLMAVLQEGNIANTLLPEKEQVCIQMINFPIKTSQFKYL